MGIKTNEAYCYWTLPINATGIPGRKSTPRPINSLGPDGTTDEGVPGIILFDVTSRVYGTFTLENIRVPALAGVQGENLNIEGVTELHVFAIFVDETAADEYVTIDAALPYDPENPEAYWSALNVPFTYSARMEELERELVVGDFLLINDPRLDTENNGVSPDGKPSLRYECAMITRIGGGTMDLQRHYPGQDDPTFSTFGALIFSHLSGVKAYKIDFQHFGYRITPNSNPLGSEDNPLPPKVDATLPTVCLVAVYAYARNFYGFGPGTVLFLGKGQGEDDTYPPMPGLRTLNGAAYVFRQDGDVIAGDDGSPPQYIHEASSVRCVFATVEDAPSGSDIQIAVKYRKADEADWTFLQTLTIPAGSLSSFPAGQKPSDRRLPFADGLFLDDPVYGPEMWPTPSLRGDYLIGYDVLQAGSVINGADLMVYVQT